MIKLKDIIKESNLITEATRWNVAVEMPNGKVTAVYGHYDGYPQYVGKILKKYYSGGAGKVRDLIKLGKNGISVLDKSMKGGKDHSFENPKKGETIFYGRDRGDRHNMTTKYRSREHFGKSFGEEFGYVYSVKERKWYYFDDRGNQKEL